MNILVVNDDGIYAEGIERLAAALSETFDVYVCAPHEQRSASGHGITIASPVEYEFAEFPKVRQAISLKGTPADCVKIGLEIYKGLGVTIDKVFSGINHGANLGTDTLYSGTVSAALEGAMCGLPSAAFSINARKPKQFDTALELAHRIAGLDYSRIDPRMTLNVNIPDLEKENIKGVKVTRLGIREYNEWYEKVSLESGNVGYRYSGYPVFYEGLTCDENDIGADQEGYVSVTPLHFDLTGYDLMGKLKEVIEPPESESNR
ncbi:MAG: 5'/3'-nucleotidase SurE [Clostridiales Family XIII bacterium]|jgi:5'-nucleotidase|nr:5'/3'-nucleotidase SurE [Clostridiales Family XIII bacterium]